MPATKTEIKAAALAHGFLATYSAKQKRWFFYRRRPRTNTPAFDRVVFYNMTRSLGIENQAEERPYEENN